MAASRYISEGFPPQMPEQREMEGISSLVGRWRRRSSQHRRLDEVDRRPYKSESLIDAHKRRRTKTQACTHAAEKWLHFTEAEP